MKTRRTLSGKARAWGWIKFFLFLIFLVFVALTSGFVTFANKVKTFAPAQNIPVADGIVVLTGKGGGRLNAGAKLLQDGKGERLLISGVNPSIPSEEVMALLDLPEDLAECCVDLDYAENTIENATETSAWSNALGYEHLILVTSAYHMPRAQSEIRHVTGRIRITPYPVSSDLADKWWKDGKSLKRLLTEYSKLVVTLMRKTRDKEAREAPISDAEIPKIQTAGPDETEEN